MHPVLEEFCRAGELRPGKLRQFQRELREIIQPLLNEREDLLVEVAQLREAYAAVSVKSPVRKERASEQHAS